MSVDQETLDKIVKNGTFYNPASKHYSYETDVKCDKCLKTGINICIGWENYDLCMSCVDLLSKKPVVPRPVVPSKPDDFTPTVCIMMMQDQFKPAENLVSMPPWLNDNRISKMLQHQYEAPTPTKPKIDNRISRMLQHQYEVLTQTKPKFDNRISKMLQHQYKPKSDGCFSFFGSNNDASDSD